MALPRPYWKGSLKLSLVSCQVLLYPASTATDKTAFTSSTGKTGNRLRQQMVDSETGDVVEGDDKGRGYELKKGQYVEIEKQELEAFRSKHPHHRHRQLRSEARDRQPLSRSSLLYAPDGKAGIDAFVVIRDAMKDQDRVALARIVLTNREHVIAIEPLGKACSAPRCDIRTNCATRRVFQRHKEPENIKRHDRARRSILDTKAAHFDPSKFKDEYENALKAWSGAGRRQAGQGPRARAKNRQCRQPDGCVAAEPEGQGLAKRSASPHAGRHTGPSRKRIGRRHGRARRAERLTRQGIIFGMRRPNPGLAESANIIIQAGNNRPGCAGWNSTVIERMSPLLLLRFRFLRSWFFSKLFRNSLAFALASERRCDRLLAAGDLLARPAAPQGAGLALFHHPLDVGRRFFRIFPCHGVLPVARKIILTNEVGSARATTAIHERRHPAAAAPRITRIQDDRCRPYSLLQSPALSR